MAVSNARVFWLSHTSTKTTLFRKAPTTFLTCFIVERQNPEKKVCLNQVSNSQPTGHESNMLTTERAGIIKKKAYQKTACNLHFLNFQPCFLPNQRQDSSLHEH